MPISKPIIALIAVCNASVLAVLLLDRHWLVAAVSLSLAALLATGAADHQHRALAQNLTLLSILVLPIVAAVWG